MKKRYIAVAIIIAIVLLLPKYIASQVSVSLTNIAASINKMPAYTAQIVEIEENWFSSTAIIKMGINFDVISTGEIDNMPTGQTQFLVDFKAAHGPIIVNDGFAIALVKWQASYAGNKLKPIMKWDASKALYQINGVQQLWNVTQFEDQIQPFIIDNQAQNIQAEFAGYVGSGTFSNNQFNYSASVGKTTIENNENSALIAELELKLNIDGNYLEAMDGKLFDTDATLNIGQFQLTDLTNQLEVLNLQSMVLEIEANVEEEHGTANVIQRMDVDSASFGGYLIQHLKMDFAINRLSLAFLEKYQKMANQLSGQDPMIMHQQMQQFAQDNVLELLSKNPELNLTNLSATLPEGELTIAAKAQTVNVTKLPEDLQDTEFWLRHLMAEANLNIDKSVAHMFAKNYMTTQLLASTQTAEMTQEQIVQIAEQQAPIILENMITQGLIVEENGTYKAAATIKDKQAILNGNPIPISD